MATTRLQIIPDLGGTPTYTLPQSNYIYSGVLSSGVAQNVTAPTDSARYMVRIGVANGADILVSVNGTADIPSEPSVASTTEVNIAQTYVNSGGTVSVISPQDDVIYSLGFYALS